MTKKALTQSTTGPSRLIGFPDDELKTMWAHARENSRWLEAAAIKEVLALRREILALVNKHHKM